MNILVLQTGREFSPKEIGKELLVLRSLYIKCWLIQQGRFSDLQLYDLTQDSRFEEEAGMTLKVSNQLNQTVPIGTRITMSAPSMHNPIIMDEVKKALQAIGW